MIPVVLVSPLFATASQHVDRRCSGLPGALIAVLLEGAGDVSGGTIRKSRIVLVTPRPSRSDCLGSLHHVGTRRGHAYLRRPYSPNGSRRYRSIPNPASVASARSRSNNDCSPGIGCGRGT